MLAGSVGCRMCGSSLDLCVPAHIQRENDYRGGDPLYRAGSIFYANGDYSNPDGLKCVDCSLTNAGNYGETRSISQKRGRPTNIGTPLTPPDSTDGPRIPDLPPIEELMQRRSTQTSAPRDIPGNAPQDGVSPFGIPEPIPTDDIPTEPFVPTTVPHTPGPESLFDPTGPFNPISPTDHLPPSPTSNPQTHQPSIPGEKVTGPKITVEDLRRMEQDSSITEIKILNINDSKR